MIEQSWTLLPILCEERISQRDPHRHRPANAQPVTNVNFWIFVGVNPITIVSPTPVAVHGSNEAGTRDGY
jgi:hypothetical protein